MNTKIWMTNCDSINILLQFFFSCIFLNQLYISILLTTQETIIYFQFDRIQIPVKQLQRHLPKVHV